MLTLKKIFTKLSIQYEDNLEEQEFNQIRTPLVRAFFKYLFIILTIIFTLYTARYFDRNVFPQAYILIGLLGFGVVIFLIQTKVEKYLEQLLIIYIITAIVVLVSVFKDRLTTELSRTSFYVGYIYAMIHRLLGYRVVNVKYIFWLYAISITLKFVLVDCSEPLVVSMVTILDVSTILLSYKSDRDERSLFDVLYKSKRDILKFKHLLTQYLPIQMAIFANDYSVSHYVNNAFKRTFKAKQPTQVKEAMDKLLVEKETIEKNKTLFKNLGYETPEDDEQQLTLSGFMGMVANNVDMLRDLNLISIPVIEAENTKNESMQVVEGQTKDQTLQRRNSDADNKIINTELPLKGTSQDNKKETAYGLIENNNESIRSSDKGSSKSISSDMAYEEGRRRVFKVKIFPLLWDDTEAIAMVFDDITQQRIIMELKVADKNKDLVIAMVSHELRTPLNGMLGLIDIAKKNISEPNTLFYLSACRDSGMLLLNLVNSILDMNQLKNKKLRLVHTPINIQELLDEIRLLFNQTCRIKNLYFKMKTDPNVPPIVNSDKNRLSQILINLLGNAFKFTFKGGVTISVELESSNPCRVRFSVEDTGIGIKKEDQDKLFQMYGKLDQQDRKINTHGVGLGLTISNSLAMLLDPTGNSKITVRSEVEQGTCFSFVIESINLETLKKNEPSGDFSSINLVEDKDTTILKKMTVYTSNNHENFSKMITSSQNLGSQTLDNRRLISPTLDKRNSDLKRMATDSLTILPSTSKGKKYAASVPKLKMAKNSLSDADDIILKIPVSSEREPLYEEIEEEENDEHERPWCMVVDDNPFNLMVACHIMEERQYNVKTALNGKEAIARAAEHHQAGHKFKVVLMDCQMPVMDGYEATRVLRKMMKAGELTECPVIALTANNRDDEHEKLCQEVGMSGHVAKPLQVNELEAVLKYVRRK